jgi:hypothetical protein
MIRGADWSADRNSYRTFGCRAAMEGTPPPLNDMVWAFVWPTERELRGKVMNNESN